MNKSLLERLLDFYHISYDEYLSLTAPTSLLTFKGDHSFKDVNKAIDLVKESIANNEKIIVYGDYDADGVMGTSILVKMFSYLNYVVDYYLPNRYNDGYGLNLEHAKEYVQKGYNLVITVDNGITAFEPIEYLKNNGVKVLVLDHHQALDHLPIADAICHPLISEFGNTTSSGAFTAFIYSISLLNRIDKYLATLAAFSVISDMMPLHEYNRNLLRAVFKDYEPGEFKALDLLADHEKLDEQLIGMKVAPRINSIGRLCEDESINEIVKFFVTDDENFILNYFSHILETNEQRKLFSKTEIDESGIDHKLSTIVIKGDFKEGIIGLVANSLMNKYNKPTVVFAKTLDGNLKGSARAPEGYNLVKAFEDASEILLTAGGHSNAAGCSIKESYFEKFKNIFDVSISKNPIEIVKHEYIDIKLNELSFENEALVKSFSPFGEGWQAPNFRLRHLKVDALTKSRDHKHIITTLGNSLKLVFFNFPNDFIENKSYVDVIGTFSKKSYKGYNYIEFMCTKFLDTED